MGGEKGKRKKKVWEDRATSYAKAATNRRSCDITSAEGKEGEQLVSETESGKNGGDNLFGRMPLPLPERTI